jgi:ATP phosphoribosyltransferase
LTTYTKAQLRNRVLRELGVLAAGETAAAEDAEVIEEMIDTQHAMLARELFVDWTTSAIPQNVFEPLAAVVAARGSGQFGVTGPRLQELLALAVQGMADLHTQTQAQDYSSAPIPATYF